MDVILDYNWELFIFLEVLSLGSLILFGIFRYFLKKPRFSILFIFLFLFLLMIEGALGLYVYRQTGEISTFQIVISSLTSSNAFLSFSPVFKMIW